MKPRRSRLSAALASALGAGVVAAAGAGAAAAQQVQKVEKIEITGSNIKRIEGEAAVPVTVVTKEDIAKSGVTSTAELMDKLQLNSGATYSLAQGVGDSGQPGFAGASLRGLGPNNTLILLNGRRVANYAFNGAAVDVNAIPLAAVERVEVLRDGASAIYGTDAIGGVINFILRKDYQGLEASAYATNTDRGGGDSKIITVTGGYGDLAKDRFNVLVSYNKLDSDPLKAAERKFASTAIRPDLGIQQTSGNTIPAAIRFDANGSLGNANPLSGSGCAPQLGSYYLPEVSTRQCRYDFTSVLDIFPPIERQSVVAKGAFQINADHTAFADYVWVDSKTTYASSETPVNDFVGNGPFIYPAGGRYYPAPFRTGDGTLISPVGDLGIAWRAKDGGRRTNEANSEATRFVAGLRGVIGKWDYEAAYNYAESKVVDTYVDGWFRESLLNAAIRSGVIDVFGINGQDAAGMAALQAAKILEDVRRSKGTVKAFDLRGSTEIMQMPAGPMALAIGAETRQEEFNDNPLPVLSSGDVLGGGGNQPVTTGDRRVTAIFAELNIPIMKELEAQLAIRSDRYSDFGSSTNPKFSLRWSPSRELLVRASAGSGFRAPSLPDLYQPRFFSNTADTHNDPIRCPGGNPIGDFVDDGLECEAQFQNQLGGVRDLQPEKSRQATLGFVFEPTRSVSIGVDGFYIQRRNSLQALSDTTVFDYYGVLDPVNAQGFFVRQQRLPDGTCVGDNPSNPTPANIPCAINYSVQVVQNVGNYSTTGADITASATWGLGEWGRLRGSLAGTWIYKYAYQFAKDGPYADNLGRFTADNGAVPEWRHTLAFEWSRGPWTATLTQNFVQGYTDAGGEREVGNVETYDLVGSWRGIRNLEVILGVRNVMDRDPPASAQGQTFQVGYDPRYGDPYGRTFFGRVTYAFK